MENSYDLVRTFPYSYTYNSFDLDNIIEMNKLFTCIPIPRTGPNCCKVPSCYLQHETTSQKLTCLTELPHVNTTNQELSFCFLSRSSSQKIVWRTRGVGRVSDTRKGHRQFCVQNIPPTQMVLWGWLLFLVSDLKPTVQK